MEGVIVGFKNSLEWQIDSVKSEAIAFLTHGSFLTGQRERYVTVYPFANLILNGFLKENPLFSNFQQNKVFIFCNLRTSRDCRPDLLAFSLKGDVFLVEAKQRGRDTEESALKTIKTGLKELEDYYNGLQEFSRKAKNAPYELWESVYRNCYVKMEKHGFPELDSFITGATILRGQKKIEELFHRINDNILNGRILFGLAFNDPRDVEPFFTLEAYNLMSSKTIKYKTNPKRGVKNLGFFEIDNGKILNMVKQKWKKSLGTLFLFGINKNNERIRILPPI
jgi:hypothetical protein